ncbi:alpha/beta fold hydrolase [Pseudokineococcus basanitobsidens]|uniref:Alpha/beta fold hydrolase n=1 Tax=Pseudokineococcus basanitobsidens TaxID=1926649 RepID=A0ABU8RJE9_9ACTN
MPPRDPRTGRRDGRPAEHPRSPRPLVVEGAQAWSAGSDGAGDLGDARVGVLALHGFTGSPASVGPWARALRAAGAEVAVPRLPGHGTSVADLDRSTWRDWYSLARADLHRLAGRCDVVVVAGLSMGGALALRLAVHEPEHVAGLALVNPAVLLADPLLPLLPLLRRVRRTVPGVADDIAAEGVTELGYDRVPLRALSSFVALMADVRADLPRVRQPVLVASSRRDHVVPAASARTVRERVGSDDVRDVRLEQSFHVATLDHDLPLVVDETLRLVRDVVAARAGADGVPA